MESFHDYKIKYKSMNKLELDTRANAVRLGDPNSPESVLKTIKEYGEITPEQVEWLVGWFQRNDTHSYKYEDFLGAPVFRVTKKGSMITKIIDNKHDAEIIINNLKYDEAGEKHRQPEPKVVAVKGKVKKGTLLIINHKRKGKFKVIALKDFDTEKDEFYPLAVAQEKPVRGLQSDWLQGEEVPARRSLCQLSILKT